MKPLSDWEMELDAAENAGPCDCSTRFALIGLTGMVLCLMAASCVGCVR